LNRPTFVSSPEPVLIDTNSGLEVPPTVESSKATRMGHGLRRVRPPSPPIPPDIVRERAHDQRAPNGIYGLGPGLDSMTGSLSPRNRLHRIGSSVCRYYLGRALVAIGAAP
jgi:hypothetical protein